MAHSVPSKKFYNERIFVLVRMQLRNHVDRQPLKRFKGYVINIR